MVGVLRGAVRRPAAARGRGLRVLVIGPGGSGKTTVSLAIAEATGLPLVHLDALYWRPGWRPAPDAEWRATVADLVARPAWVMDGNYGGTLGPRIAAADTIVFLDLPRLVCLWRILERRVAYGGRARPSLPEGCPERLTLEFVRWVWTYRSRRRPGVLARLEEVAGEKEVVVLRSAQEVARFVEGLPGPLPSRPPGASSRRMGR